MHAACSRKLPAKLYKYLPLGTAEYQARVQDVVCNSRIYFASPGVFNDPFDCRVRFAFTGSDAEVLDAMSRNMARTGHPPLSEEEAANILRGIRTPAGSAILHDRAQKEANKLGVYCLAESPCNLTMWAHYATSHQGLCLVFDTTHEPFSQSINVRYSNTYLQVDIAESGEPEMAIRSLFTKSLAWSSEAEWRLVEDSPGKYSFPPEALVGIIHGHRIERSDRTLLHELAEQRALPLQVAVPHGERFDLVVKNAI